MREYEIRLTEQILDQIKVKDILEPGIYYDLRDLQDLLTYYAKYKGILPEIFKGDLFNFMSIYEFDWYLRQRGCGVYCKTTDYIYKNL